MLYYKWWLVLAGISGGLAVMAGAAGAHALRGALSPEGLEQFHTAVRYHFIHTLAIIACAFLLQAQGSANPLLPHLAAAAFFIGLLLFSGSLYLLAFAGMASLTKLVPIGGMFFILGWLLFAMAAALLTHQQS